MRTKLDSTTGHFPEEMEDYVGNSRSEENPVYFLSEGKTLLSSKLELPLVS